MNRFFRRQLVFYAFNKLPALLRSEFLDPFGQLLTLFWSQAFYRFGKSSLLVRCQPGLRFRRRCRRSLRGSRPWNRPLHASHGKLNRNQNSRRLADPGHEGNRCQHHTDEAKACGGSGHTGEESRSVAVAGRLFFNQIEQPGSVFALTAAKNRHAFDAPPGCTGDILSRAACRKEAGGIAAKVGRTPRSAWSLKPPIPGPRESLI